MKKLIRRYWISFTIGMGLGGCLILYLINILNGAFDWGDLPANQVFNQQVWMDSAAVKWHNPRYDMIDDLENKYLRIGMTKVAVIELLGQPDFTFCMGCMANEDNIFRYELGINGLFMEEPYAFDIELDHAGIVKMYTTTEH